MNNTPENLLTLAEIVQSVKKGDEQAFRLLFDQLHPPIFRYCLSRAQSREEALDLTQDILIDLWQSLRRFHYRNDPQLYGFVFLIARRKLAKHWQRHKVTVQWDDRYVRDNYQLEIENYQPLLASIQRLKPKYQEVVRLRYWSQLSFGEIAQALGIREGTAKVWHLRAIRELQKLSPHHE